MGTLKQKWMSLPVAAKASAAYAICSIVQRCLSFFTMPLFTRMMTKEQYGISTVYSSWSGIFSILLTLNLAYGSFSPAMVRFEKDRNGYASSIQGITLVLGLLFLVIYLPLQTFWNSILKLPTILVLFLVAETILVNAINTWSGIKRFEYQYIPVVAVTLGMTVLSVVLSVFFVLRSPEDTRGSVRIMVQSGVTIAIGVVIFILTLVRGKHIINKEYWTYALKFNIPLLAYYLSQTVFNQSDRIMIDHYSGKDKAAVYGVAYNLAMILTFVLNAINNSYVPWFYQKIKDGKEKENAKVSLGIAALMAVLILAVVIMAPEVITIMAGEAYREAVWIIPPVAISLLLLFYSQLFINVQFYYEKKGKLVYASIGAAVVNIVLNVLLIPTMSYIAAGYTTMISYVIFAMMNYFTMRSVAKQEGLDPGSLNMRNLILLFVGFCVLCFAAMTLYPFMIVRYAVVGVGLIVCLVMHKQIIRFIKTTILQKG